MDNYELIKSDIITVRFDRVGDSAPARLTIFPLGEANLILTLLPDNSVSVYRQELIKFPSVQPSAN